MHPVPRNVFVHQYARPTKEEAEEEKKEEILVHGDPGMEGGIEGLLQE